VRKKNFFERGLSKEERLAVIKPLLEKFYMENKVISSRGIDSCDYLPSYSVIRSLFSEPGKNSAPIYKFIGARVDPYTKYYIDRQKYDIDMVREIFMKGGCTLISDNYKNATDKLKYICSCGNQSEVCLHNFMKGNRCNNCKKDRYGKKQKDTVVKMNPKKLKKVEFKPKIIVRKSYYKKVDPANKKSNISFVLCGRKILSRNNDEKGKEWVEFQCDCGNICKKQLTTFRATPWCRECSSKKWMAGETHYNWQGGKSKERDLVKRNPEYVEWRNKVYTRDSHTCRRCGDNKGHNLHAHHIMNWSSNTDLRYDIENGITLCNNCHNPAVKGSFHNLYGTNNNTRKQIEEYLLSHREELDLCLKNHVLEKNSLEETLLLQQKQTSTP
jgi:hypothetical protein